MSRQQFTGKVVLITGASSGIGAETAVQFSKLGANLALTGRNFENLKKTQQKCSDCPKILLITADLTNDCEIKQIIEKTIQEFKKLDVLVDNAGIYTQGDIETTKLEEFDEVLNTNVRAVFQLTQLAIPHLKATKRNIVNVSSLAGLRCTTNILSYCISKSALDKLTQCTALELAKFQIRVNSVNPGVILTEIFDKSGMSEQQMDEYLRRSNEVHPIGRSGKPEEVAHAIIFLASDKASFISGVLFPVDSGRHVACPT